MRFTTPMGIFEIESMPSQVQVAICHGFFVHENLRGKGYAYQLHKEQIAELIVLGYDYAICTVSGVNPAQSKSIEKAGWKLTHTFLNSRIGEKTEVWELDISSLRNTKFMASDFRIKDVEAA